MLSQENHFAFLELVDLQALCSRWPADFAPRRPCVDTLTGSAFKPNGGRSRRVRDEQIPPA